ncbi:MAG TPA: RDD family protein [Polyangiales bacterium]|nr:RDD family protein [Polyangiales bacterium]
MRDLFSIRTPENVSFDFELAGVGSRALAWAVDVLAMGVLTTLSLVCAKLFGVVFAGLARALYLVLAFAIQWGYGALLEWLLHGQTLGKRLLGLRVISREGSTITFAQAAVRNLVRIVDILPGCYLVGGTSALLDRHGRRLGDLAAGTVVVRQRSSPRPAAVLAPVDRYNSFSHDQTLAHAAERITAPERDTMIGLALRRESLPVVVRYALFSKLARHLERRLSVARPNHLSEERFVLNLTAIVLQRRKTNE